LFGSAIDHASVYLCALDEMGRAGIGGRHNRLVLHRLEAIQPAAGAYTFFERDSNTWGNVNNALFTAGDWINSRQVPKPVHQLTFRFATLLRLQDNNHLQRTAPAFATLFSRLLGRINSLACFHGNTPALQEGEKSCLLEASSAIETVASDLQWQDWNRYSARQQTWMKFGGLAGQITYRGDFSRILPYLLFGELVHVGAKTSFGLGKYAIHPFTE
jgi:hypothetical protein